VTAAKPFTIPKGQWLPGLLDGSGVSREAPAPFWERLEVKSLRPTHHNLHWTLDVAFREDECRTRKDYSAFNLAVIRHAALNILKREASKVPIKRKRVKAAVNPDFRAALLKC
jgi:hypothetical protein